MREVEDQAMQEWKPANGNRAQAVSDFDRIIIPPYRTTALSQETEDVESLGEAMLGSLGSVERTAESSIACRSGQATDSSETPQHAPSSRTGGSHPFRGRGHGPRGGALICSLSVSFPTWDSLS